MKTNALLSLAVGATALLMTCCTKDEPQDKLTISCEVASVHSFLKSADRKAKVNYIYDAIHKDEICQLIIPAEGGVFEFELNDAAQVKYENTFRPLTSFRFLLCASCERVLHDADNNYDDILPADSEYVPSHVTNSQLSNEVNCQFGKITTEMNSFTLEVTPNTEGHARVYDLIFDEVGFQGMDVMPSQEIVLLWQLGK